jgi:hypothetical protein
MVRGRSDERACPLGYVGLDDGGPETVPVALDRELIYGVVVAIGRLINARAEAHVRTCTEVKPVYVHARDTIQ